MYDDIKKSFIGEEERKFHKSWTAKAKSEMRHEAKLDLEEENRQALAEHKQKLEAELRKNNAEEVLRLSDALRMEEERVKGLEGELRALREECARSHVIADVSRTSGGT